MKKYLLITTAALAPFSLAAQDADDTERERSLIVGFLEDKLSTAGRDIRIEGFRGALSSEATLDELTISDDEGVWFTLRDTVLDWNRSALLRGRVDITSITAAEIILERLPDVPESAASPEAKPFALPDLPVSIEIEQIEAERVFLGAPVAGLGEDLELSISGSASLADGSGDIDITADRIPAEEGALTLKAGYDGETGLVTLDLDLEEAANGLVAGLMNIPGAPPLSLTAKGEGPLDDFTADIALATSGEDRVTGTVEIASAAADPATDTLATQQELTEGEQPEELETARVLTVDLSGDLRPLMPADYSEFFGESSRLQARGAAFPSGVIDLERFNLSTKELGIFGAARIGADGLPESFNISGTVESPSDLPSLLPIPGERTLLGSAGIVASYDMNKDEAWTAEITLQDLKRGDLSLAEATLGGSGTIARRTSDASDGTLLREVDADLSFSTRDLETGDQGLQDALGSAQAGRVVFRWRDGEPLDIELLRVVSAATEATLSGILESREDDGIAFDGTLDIDTPRLVRFASLAGLDLEGEAQATASGTVNILSGAFDLQVSVDGKDIGTGIEKLDPLLVGESRIELDARRDQSGLTLRTATVNSSAVSIAANGTLSTESADLTLDASIDDVGRLDVQGLSGPASLAGTVSRDGETAPWDANLSLEAADGTMARVIGAVTLPDPMAEGTAAQDYTFDGDIRMSTPSLTPYSQLAGQTISGGLDLSTSGRVAYPSLTFDLEATAQGSNLSIGNERIDPLIAGQSNLVIDASRNASGLTVDVGRLNTNALTVDASGTLLETGGDFRVNARLDDIARIGAGGLSGPVTVDGTVSRASADGPWQTNATLGGPGGATATVSGPVAADFGTANLDITGTAPLGFANTFTDAVLVSGTASFDLNLDGPLALSSLNGTVSTGGGTRVVVPAAEIALDFNPSTVVLQGEQATLNLSATPTGGGSISIDGGLGLGAGLPANLAIGLTNFALSDPTLYSTTINGTLNVNGPLTGGAQITGDVLLGETDVIVTAASLGAGDVLNVTHVGESRGVDATLERAGVRGGEAEGRGGPAVAYPLNVRVSAPNQIFVRGHGLDAELGGELQVTGTTANIIPIGQFTLIRGRLSILGQRLDMEEGRLTLQGDLNPYVYLVASTESDDIDVQIITSGNVRSPELQITSNPNLPQEEVLSQLLFGSSLSEISALEAAQMAAAISTLVGGGGGVVGTIRETFGLDDLDVDTNEEGNTTLRVGKYLTDNIYTDVEVDSEGESVINLNLDATDDITFKGSVGSDGESSVGVYFERDY